MCYDKELYSFRFHKQQAHKFGLFSVHVKHVSMYTEKEMASSSKSSLEDTRLLPSTSSESTFSDESGEPEQLSKYCTHSEYSTNHRFIILSIIITLLVTTAFQQIYHHLAYSQDQVVKSAVATLYSEQARRTPQHHCGNSSSEALAQGCVFDFSVVGWIPLACHDPELAQRFLDFGWRIYEDEAGTREVSLERLAASAGTGEFFWVTHGYHITHCELAWERMHRSLIDGKMRLTTHLLELEHMKHCGRMLESRVPLEKIYSQIAPILNTC